MYKTTHEIHEKCLYFNCYIKKPHTRYVKNIYIVSTTQRLF